MTIQALKHSFTVNEYHKMAHAGILTEDERIELIKGEIIDMTPIGSRHAACVDLLDSRFTQKEKGEAIVRVQNPIQVESDSEPQPDITLLTFRSDFYSFAHPTQKDVLLLIEVSEYSEEFDRDVKIPLYANAGIQEVWLIDLIKEKIL